MKSRLTLFTVTLFLVLFTSMMHSSAEFSPNALSDVEQPFYDAALVHLSQDGNRDVNQLNIRDLVVTSDGKYALADWNYGHAGGVTLMENNEGQIGILTHGGGALLQSDLEAMGIPSKSATELMAEED